MTDAEALRRVRWIRLHHPGTDHATLWRVGPAWRISGVARIRYPEGPTVVHYRIDCAPDWRTTKARIDLHAADGVRKVDLSVDSAGVWTVSGFAREDLAGCVDIDLTATPSTNLLPIRRLHLDVGAAAEIPVAWITFPDLVVHPVRQRYTRLTDRTYLYDGLHNGFQVEFDVDEVGFVVSYPGFWERAPLAGGH